MRLDAGSLVHYADWAARNDIHEGEDVPVIILLKKPDEFELSAEDRDRANRIPIFVKTERNIQPENILDIVSMKKIIKKHPMNNRNMDNAVILKVWKALQQLETK